MNTLKNIKNKENFDKEMINIVKKKKKIRQILDSSVKEANLKQFREYYSNNSYQPNTQIISLNRHLPRSFNKWNIQKIIGTLEAPTI